MSEEGSAESFEAFMSRALMDPVKGYYSRRVTTIGACGDFATSASVGTGLARAIAGWLRAEMRRQPGVRTVMEIGGGDGSLMKEVRKQLGWWKRWRCRWVMVERSVPLRAQQQKRLGSRVRWYSCVEEALEECGGRAFIWHNEFLDALPFALMQWSAEEEAWQEVWLRKEGLGNVREELRPIDPNRTNSEDFALTREWNRQVVPLSPKQRGEVHTGVRRWLQGWVPHWRAGSMLCLDYGDVFPVLYHRRPRGSARAYLLHQRLEGAEIYQNAGRQDITSDINFADLRRWCTELGCEEAGYGTQAHFLRQYSSQGATAGDGYIFDPDGAGAAFKYLMVRPGTMKADGNPA